MRERDRKKAEYLRGIFDRYLAAFRVEAGGDAPSVARRVHAAIDDVLARDRKKSPDNGGIRCGKGCSHCCHGPVEIWPQEAALLIEGARASGVAIDPARLERQSRCTVETWREQPPADRACAFLGGDGACGVYEYRPNACRKLLVLSDPEFCDADRHAPAQVGRWFSWESEVLESAALEVFGRALMPQSLLAELERRRQARAEPDPVGSDSA